mgnify:CR=1 FL=1
MTIEQHAEAAANEIDRSATDGPKTIIAKHMQSAVDEATAPLKARIAELEGLWPLIGRLQALSMAYQAEDKASDEFCRVVDELRAAESQINAILKGGAS